MRILKLSIIIGFLLLTSFLLKTKVNAATSLYFSPSSGSYYVGNNFTIGVYISTSQPVNAVESNISYDTSKLTLVSCTSGGTGFDTPIPVSTTGCTNLVVGTTGSYTGGAGRVGTITFKAKAAGSATISVSGTSAMGGTAIATGGSSRSYTFTTYVAPAQAPGAVNVTSASHADPSLWYQADTATLTWNKDNGVTGFSYVLDQNNATSPSDSQNTTDASANLTLSQEGSWYFHIKAQSAGGWGPVTHFQINYDKTSPNISSASLEYNGDLRPVVTFDAEDALSGVDKYELSIDGGANLTIASPYTSDALELGQHSFVLKVYDKAGNEASRELNFNVDKINSPEITELIYENLFLGNTANRLVLKGKSPKGSTVLIELSPGDLNGSIKTNDDGTWEFIFDRGLQKGDYKITVTASIDGKQSEDSKEYTFVLGDSGISNLPLTGSGSSMSSWGVLILVFIAGLMVGGGVLFYILHIHKIQNHTSEIEKRKPGMKTVLPPLPNPVSSKPITSDPPKTVS